MTMTLSPSSRVRCFQHPNPTMSSSDIAMRPASFALLDLGGHCRTRTTDEFVIGGPALLLDQAEGDYLEHSAPEAIAVDPILLGDVVFQVRPQASRMRLPAWQPLSPVLVQIGHR